MLPFGGLTWSIWDLRNEVQEMGSSVGQMHTWQVLGMNDADLQEHVQEDFESYYQLMQAVADDPHSAQKLVALERLYKNFLVPEEAFKLLHNHMAEKVAAALSGNFDLQRRMAIFQHLTSAEKLRVYQEISNTVANSYGIPPIDVRWVTTEEKKAWGRNSQTAGYFQKNTHLPTYSPYIGMAENTSIANFLSLSTIYEEAQHYADFMLYSHPDLLQTLLIQANVSEDDEHLIKMSYDFARLNTETFLSQRFESYMDGHARYAGQPVENIAKKYAAAFTEATEKLAKQTDSDFSKQFRKIVAQANELRHDNNKTNDSDGVPLLVQANLDHGLLSDTFVEELMDLVSNEDINGAEEALRDIITNNQPNADLARDFIENGEYDYALFWKSKDDYGNLENQPQDDIPAGHLITAHQKGSTGAKNTLYMHWENTLVLNHIKSLAAKGDETAVEYLDGGEYFWDFANNIYGGYGQITGSIDEAVTLYYKAFQQGYGQEACLDRLISCLEHSPLAETYVEEIRTTGPEKLQDALNSGRIEYQTAKKQIRAERFDDAAESLKLAIEKGFFSINVDELATKLAAFSPTAYELVKELAKDEGVYYSASYIERQEHEAKIAAVAFKEYCKQGNIPILSRQFLFTAFEKPLFPSPYQIPTIKGSEAETKGPRTQPAKSFIPWIPDAAAIANAIKKNLDNEELVTLGLDALKKAENAGERGAGIELIRISPLLEEAKNAPKSPESSSKLTPNPSWPLLHDGRQNRART